MITGGSKGLGLEVVRQWIDADDCLRVIVLDVYKSKKLEQIEHSANSKLTFVLCDMADRESFEHASSVVLTRYKHIDVLICNSGIRQRNKFMDLTEEETDAIFSVNYFSHVKLIKKVINANEEFCSGSRLHIVVVASVLGFIAPKTLCHYSATKSSLINFMDSIRHELPPSVVLTSIAPGQLTTEMFSDVKVNNHFLAPLVDHRKLAHRITDVVDFGYNGLFVYPLYGRLIPALRCLPYWLYESLRKFSQMDDVL